MFHPDAILTEKQETSNDKMKKNIKNILIYSGIFVILLIIGVIISDAIIIFHAKHILKTADSIPFEKDMHKVYPAIPAEKNALYIINKVYNKRNALPDDLKQLDEQINSTDLRSDEIPLETLQKFWNNKEVIAVVDELSSVPYTAKFSLNYADEPEKLNEKIIMLNSMFNFYLHYLKFCAVEKQHLQTLHAFQKLLIINRAFENQKLTFTEIRLQKNWIAAIDALVHYGPTGKRYEEYYHSLQKLIDSLDFKYHPELTYKYNELKNFLNYKPFEKGFSFAAHRNYIGTLKYITINFSDFLRSKVIIEKKIFEDKKMLTQTHLKTLMQLKLYQMKHGFFPEAIEGFPTLEHREKLLYKRISPNDFILKNK